MRAVRFPLPILLALTLVTSPSLAGSAVAIQPETSPQPAREAARAALDSLDMPRLLRDRTYAEEILRHLDALDAESRQGPTAQARAGLRSLALATLARREEAQSGIDRLLSAGSAEVGPFAFAWWSALILEDLARAVNVIESASRQVPGVGRPELRRVVDPITPRLILGRLRGDANRPLRVRFAAALLTIGWPGDSDRVAADDLRTIVIDDSLAQGDGRAAAQMASMVQTPPSILSLIVLRRYDAVIGADRDRLAMLRTALAEEDRETEAALATAASSLDYRLARVNYLRAVGRDAEAWALVEPATRDVAATVASGDNGMWLISRGVGALYALRRDDEAVALGNRLVAVPLEVNALLINVYINHIGFLGQTGHPAESLDHARRVERDHGSTANTYGKMWISAGIICALADLGRAGEAAPVLAAMRATSEDNIAAMGRAHLCLGDVEAAEALLIRQLENPETASVALDFQEFELDPRPAEAGSLGARLRALRERPAVRDALTRVARSLRLPMAENSW